MIGSVLNNRYRMDAELGRGGMGVVYRAYDTLLERDVAVKVLSGSVLGSEGQARLLGEAQSAAQLNHPNIVSVHDAGEHEGSPFIVMELVDGMSLHEQPPQEVDDILAIARQVCAALDHAHRHGIVHRDLKPENVLVTQLSSPVHGSPSGNLEERRGVRAKLTDFGLARSVASRISSEGTIVGTVFYLAPELALGQAFDGRADLYALGVMLYELITGRLPFSADDPVAVISQHLHAPVVPPRARYDGIPAGLDALIVRLMSKRPEDRPASAGEVLQALEELDYASPDIAVTSEFSVLDRIVRGRLVGRERELAEASSLWGKAVAGQGGVLLISGEPGIGKTRLVQEIATRSEVSGGQVLTGECYSEGGAPYAPVAHMIRTAMSDGSGLELPELVVADLITIAPDLGVRYPNVPPNPPLDPSAEQQRMFESVAALCKALTDQAPLLICLEDVHWAGSGTLYLLRYLARRLSRCRALIVATYREVELDEARPFHNVLLDLNRARLANRLKLSRLDRDQTHDLLATMFAEEITPEFLEGIYRETEGNPFFVEEVVRELVESGKLYFKDGRWVRPRMEDLEIPQSVRVAIQARVGKLSQEGQDTLQAAAILGREFDFETLAEISDLDEEELINALESAGRAQLIRELDNRGGEWFAFGHALVPAALRENLSGLRRGRQHRRVAAAIEKLRPEDYEALAYHYGEAGDEARALVNLTKAADRALAVYANHEAENHYRAALEIVAGAPQKVAERAALLSGLGEALFRQSYFEEAIHTWQPAITLYESQKDDDHVALLYARSARAAWWGGNAPLGLQLTQDGLAAVSEGAETLGWAILLHEAGRAYHFNILPNEAIPFCQRALEMAERLNDIEVQVETLTTLGLAYAGNRQFDVSIETLKKAVKLAEPLELSSAVSRAHHNLGGRLAYIAGNLEAGRDHLLLAVELDRRAGSVASEYNGLSITTFPSLFLADFAAVEETLPRLRYLLDTLADPESGGLWLRTAEALLLRYRGALPEATQRLSACIVEARQQDSHPWRYYATMTTAKAMLESSLWEEAEDVLTEYLELYDRAWGTVMARCLLSTLYARRGQAEEAGRLLSETQERFGQQITPFEEETLLLAQAHLAAAECRWPDAFLAFEATADLQNRMGKRWYRAQTWRELAEAYATRGEEGDRGKARSLLLKALAAFQDLDVPKYAALICDRLEGFS